MGASGYEADGKTGTDKNFENRILAALRPEEYARLKASFQILPLRRKTVLNEPGRPLMDTVYFPRTAVASMVTTMVMAEPAPAGGGAMTTPAGR